MNLINSQINTSKISMYVLWLIMFCFIHGNSKLFSQQIIVIDSEGRLAQLDIEECTRESIAHIGYYTDIASHPDGFFYIINAIGELYRVDLSIPNISRVHKFEGNLYYALTANSEGDIFAASANGDLGSYNPFTGDYIKYPKMGVGASGDLTLYKGQLYMATFENTLISVYPMNPELNQVIIDFDEWNTTIFGIVSLFEDCEVKTFAISGDRHSRIFEIDWEEKAFIERCSTDEQIYGGASLYEFIGSNEGLVLEDYNYTNKECEDADIEVELKGVGYSGKLEYSLDGINYSVENKFSFQKFGSFEVYIRDEFGCIGKDTFELIPGNLDISVSDIVDKTCDKLNGSFNLEIISNAYDYSITVNNIDFENDNTFSGLDSGKYHVEVSDSNGCSEETFIELGEVPKFKINDIEINHSECGFYNGEIFIESDGEGIAINANGEFFYGAHLQGLGPGDINILISDANNCRIDTTLSILTTDNCQIFIPNIFSPNADGINDQLSIHSNISHRIMKFAIYDRWGNKVFERNDFDLFNEEILWDGTIQGRKSPEGIYAYLMVVKGIGSNIIINGDISLKR